MQNYVITRLKIFCPTTSRNEILNLLKSNGIKIDKIEIKSDFQVIHIFVDTIKHDDIDFKIFKIKKYYSQYRELMISMIDHYSANIKLCLEYIGSNRYFERFYFKQDFLKFLVDNQISFEIYQY